MKNYVYIDYENMGNLKSFPKIDGAYFVFIGANQKTVPKSLVFATNENKVNWIEIEGSGKNALDFHIAYCLAKNDSDPEVCHYILSKDKGFDPLIAYVNKTKGAKSVKRIVSLNDITSRNAKNENDNTIKTQKKNENYEKLKKNLKSTEKSKRPKSKEKLKSYIQALLGKDQRDEDEVKSSLKNYTEIILSAKATATKFPIKFENLCQTKRFALKHVFYRRLFKIL